MGCEVDPSTPAGRLIQAVWDALALANRDPGVLEYDLLDAEVRLALPRQDGTQSVLRLPYSFLDELVLEDHGVNRFAAGWVVGMTK